MAVIDELSVLGLQADKTQSMLLQTAGFPADSIGFLLEANKEMQLFKQAVSKQETSRKVKSMSMSVHQPSDC